MKFEKYISKEGLYGKLTESERQHRSDTIVERMASWAKTGMSRREALKRSLLGVSAEGFPDYRHRSFVADVAPMELLEPEPFEFTNNLSSEQAQRVIDSYLEKYPRPRMYK